MGWLNILLIVLLVSGVGTCTCHGTSEPVKNVSVRPGDNITLYCDCKTPTGVYISWFKNCSHEYQPTLVINIIEHTREEPSLTSKKIARFEFVKNDSSDSYDLLITNFTESDEGIYYCGTREKKIKEGKQATGIDIDKYSNTSTRLLINAGEPDSDSKTSLQDCGLCWKLLFSMCPVLFVLSAALSFLTIYLCCHKRETTSQHGERKQEALTKIEEVQLQYTDTELLSQEDVCYAALEIHQASQRVKRKRTIQGSDYAVYSSINKSKTKGDSNFA
ncbi:uncharacterized protein LOC112450827 isoform X2 [Kryptolebias marmoratus]|uniref:uncharacterized protein LOC112450827 isoform X2 n=1 Tax=Kryptolebias marmoratus TaxID=37003 RepID=UPI0018AC9C8E|nr:uncharacterized protein LOC112450827 isoform X2 [Kryptolebias marmoratus]